MNLFENVQTVSMAQEMESSFMDYAMSVIVSRALPDVRDGLKPVHRRILYALHDLGIGWDKPYRKSAYMVGEVLGKYHPHGDSSVYEAAVRMVQEFATRYPLIDGQGNWGSVDGDSAAALRYTELRMSKIAGEMLADIDKNTVEFMDNYDATRQEPVVLPARIPNLLINGSTGIAVGMATNIPPHNLGEVANGLIHLIDHPEATVRDLIKYIKGPDFPTGGDIIGMEGIVKAYETGRGSIKMRAKAEIESLRGGKNAIVIRELPYQVNKAKLVEKIADLVKDKRTIDGISDLRDESDRDGIRVVIEVKRDANPNLILNQLFKQTQLEDNFGVIMLALVNGEPKELNLKEMLWHYLEHRKDVVLRCTRYQLLRAENRIHILYGLTLALDNLDEVIKIIRKSKDTAEARRKLQERFGLSEMQTAAVLEMRLQKLTGLERSNLQTELHQLEISIASLKEILANEFRVMEIIKADLKDVKSRYGDSRKTEIRKELAELPIRDMIPEEEMFLVHTQQGFLKRQLVDDLLFPRRGMKRTGGQLNTRDGFIREIITASTHELLLLLSNRGKVFSVPVHKIKESAGQARGVSFTNLLGLSPGEKILLMTALPDLESPQYLLMVTRSGSIKKTRISDLGPIKDEGNLAINLQDEDEVAAARITRGSDDIVVATDDGMMIRFSEDDIRPSGRTSQGIRAIQIKQNHVISMGLVSEGSFILTITENGYVKRTDIAEYHGQSRGGKGVRAVHLTEATGKLKFMSVVGEVGEFAIMTSAEKVLTYAYRDVPLASRTGRSGIIKGLQPKESIVALSSTAAQPLAAEGPQ